MNQHTEHDLTAWAEVDDALRTYPLTPTPATLRPAIMARLRALTPAPRFRLQFLDYAVSLFGAGMLGLGLALWQSITPQMAAHLQLQFLYLAQILRFNTALLGPALMLGAALAGLAALAGMVVFRRGWARAVAA